MFVLQPNASMFPEMMAEAALMSPAMTLEQNFLSRYFDWQKLPPIFNSPANMYLCNPVVFSDARVIHYTHAKPWQPENPMFNIWYRDMHALWWRAFEDMERGYHFVPR